MTGFNAISLPINTSIARVQYLGVDYIGLIDITVSSSHGSYQLLGIIQPTAIYHYTDAGGVPISHTITVSASGYQDAIVIVTPITGGQFIDFNLIPVVFSGLAGVLQNVPVANDTTQELDRCLCGVECVYFELVLTDSSDATNDYRNDKSSFLFDRLSSGNIISLELWKDGQKITDIIDNTYGEYYSSFAEQPLYTGVVIEWQKATSLHGFGVYQVRVQKTIFGTVSTFESRYFRALPFSEELADGTVKMQSVQSGSFVNGLNYENLLDEGWSEQYRIKGFFGFKEHSLEQDIYKDASYRIEQIRDEITREYRLESRLLPAVVSDWVLERATLSNRLFITDYNLLNSHAYTDKEVRALSFEEVISYDGNSSIKFLLKFTDAVQNVIKRNF